MCYWKTILMFVDYRSLYVYVNIPLVSIYSINFFIINNVYTILQITI